MSSVTPRCFPPCRPLGLSTERTADVLDDMGILVDDRQPSFEDWLERKLDGIAPGIARDTERWLRTLHEGGPRARPRAIETVWNYLNYARPVLLTWSDHYDHLREITRDDVLSALDALHGSQRQNTLIALRSLFGTAKKTGAVFRNPTTRIRIGERHSTLVQPLRHDQVEQTATAAVRPADRLIIALATIHATRSAGIRHLQLDDIDLGNRRLTITGRTRPLDELTHRELVGWLDYRRSRWPNTADPHLLINPERECRSNGVSGPTRRMLVRWDGHCE